MAKIMKTDGTIFDAPDDYVLSDGESLVGHSFTFMDHALDDTQRAVADAERISDAQKASDECAERFREAMASVRERNAPYYQACADALRGTDKAADSAPDATPWKPQSLDESRAALRAARDAANEEYRQRISEAWRTP
jgi:hypothetical protein